MEGDAPSATCDVLVVDDDADTVEVLRCFLAGKGLRVHGIVRSTDYARDIARERPRLLLLDVMLGNKNGIDAYRRAAASNPGWSCQVYLMTAVPPADARCLAASCGAAGVLAKPFDLDAVLALADTLVAARDVIP